MSGFIPIQPEYVLIHTGREDRLTAEKDKYMSMLQKYNEENETSFELAGVWTGEILVPLSNTYEKFEQLGDDEPTSDAPSLAIFKVCSESSYMDLIYGLYLAENFYCQSIGIVSMCYNPSTKCLLVELDSA